MQWKQDKQHKVRHSRIHWRRIFNFLSERLRKCLSLVRQLSVMMKKKRKAVSRHGNVNPGTVFWLSKMSPLKAQGRYIVADLLFGSVSLFVFGLKWLKLSPTVTKSTFLFISIINRKITWTSFRGVLWGAEWCLYHMPHSCWGGKNKNCMERKLELVMIVLSSASKYKKKHFERRAAK